METKISPTVSIGMPVFNGEKFLQRALDSLLTQDYAGFELIISDNASTDGTEKICREYAVRDSRIKYIRQAKNLGAYGNFNFVLQESRSEYFMWAAVDDQWDASFISALTTELEKEQSAVAAFCPYQLVEEETNIMLKGVCAYNYESRYAFVRLLKFTWRYYDTCIYGLIRRRQLGGIKFTPWAWINANNLYNVAYPVVYLLLSKGNFLLIGNRPLWFKSVKTKYGHASPFASNPLLGYLAHVVRKINLVLRSVKYIYLGSKSILLALLIIPFLLIRFLRDCAAPIYAAAYILLSGKKISQMSPHEIWRLGVR